ncbi:retrovirus-related pol polyprotein from transposon TNT 1-94 [Tanacetum coccineum]
MLERGSYIPWASRFKRFLNRKRENQKWLLKALEDGPYVFRNITPTGATIPRNQEVVQGDRVNIQSRNSGNDGRNNRRAYVQEEVVKGMNATNETVNVQRIVRTPTQAILQCVKHRLCTIDDDQINSNIQFDSVKGNVNSGSVEKDTHVYDLCALETLARNAYDEAAKQQRFAQKVQQQNMTLTSQIEMYKERNRVLENITKDNNYLKEFLKADERAKRVQKQAESQLYRDRDIIRDLEKQRDKLRMNATSSVRRPKSRDLHVKTSVLDVSKHEAKKEAVYWLFKAYDGDHSLLRNFIEKFIGTVRFGNDNFAAITGYAEKATKASHPPKLIPSDYSKIELLQYGFCGSPMESSFVNACFTQNRSIINTRHNKTPYELLRGRKPNVEYFHVFGSLCYPTNDRDDLGKMKPKADIGVFIGYSETSRGFRIYNRPPKGYGRLIHVKFDELTAIASEHDCLEPELQRFNNQNSSDDLMNTPSKEDLDNLFGPMFEDYFKQKSSDTTINSAAQPTHDQEDSPSTSSIIVDTHEAPPVVTTSDEQTSPISLQDPDEFKIKKILQI